TPGERKEYLKMLEEAGDLLQQGSINVRSMMKLIISRSPIAIKSVLYHVETSNMGDWGDFCRVAEGSAYIGYQEESDVIIPRKKIKVIKKSYNGKFKKEKKKGRFCLMHGKGNHDTNFCRNMKELVARSKDTKRKNIEAISARRVGDNENESSENLINKIDSYTLKPDIRSKLNFFNSLYIADVMNETNDITNPFKISINFNGKLETGLIDSGADVSLISSKLIKF
ncbi:hypothetical protein COBT_003324, partial [Conglomerata obtusa]